MARKLMLHKIDGFKEYLHDAYIARKLTMAQVGKECNITAATVLNHLRRYNIPTRKAADVNRGRKVGQSVKDKLSKAMKGREFSKEHKAKISQTRILRKIPSPNWRGGKRTGRIDGYIQKWMPGHEMANQEGYVMEHRLIMSKMLNRNIRPEEIVHHINGIRNDNRPENLGIFNSIGDHTAYHAYFRRMEKHA